MRLTPLFLAAAISGLTSTASSQSLVPPPAASQTPGALAAPAPAAGILAAGEFNAAIEFGVRATSVSGDAARFQRLRDERSGPTIDRARYFRDTGTWSFSASASRVGYRDQRYVAGVERYGKLKASFEWNQIPLFISADTRTPYTETEPGVFRLDDDLQRAVQAGAGTIGGFLRDVKPFAVRSRRDVADLRVSYSATRELDLRLALTSTRREGAQPGGAPFGQNLSVELPVPIDHRTNDLSATAEWSNARGMARLAYDGSWFSNHVGTLVFDNPLRATDRVSTGVDGPSQG
ncbi:MAG: MtrB/PioB family outer membrane beta-barrel protein, partial [Vicinamibacterales bacterium]